MSAIGVHGADCALGHAFVERLLRADLTVEVEPHLLAELSLKFADTLRYGSAKLGQLSGGAEQLVCLSSSAEPIAGTTFLVHPSSADLESGSGITTVEIHDLLLPSPDSAWGPMEIHTWISALQQEGEEVAELDLNYPTRHWVGLRDAVEGLFTLVTGEWKSTGKSVLHMCGRRAWSAEVVAAELTGLMRRTMHASTKSFDGEDLSPSNPVKSVAETVSDSVAGVVSGPSAERPDLAPLHDALVEIQPEGWRPLTPVRVSLMEAIATHLS